MDRGLAVLIIVLSLLGATGLSYLVVCHWNKRARTTLGYTHADERVEHRQRQRQERRDRRRAEALVRAGHRRLRPVPLLPISPPPQLPPPPPPLPPAPAHIRSSSRRSRKSSRRHSHSRRRSEEDRRHGRGYRTSSGSRQINLEPVELEVREAAQRRIKSDKEMNSEWGPTARTNTNPQRNTSDPIELDTGGGISPQAVEAQPVPEERLVDVEPPTAQPAARGWHADDPFAKSGGGGADKRDDEGQW
ncbi:hypothetical protein BDV25DRAFT_140765 [Aspergillus avenaceus]|uniref:Uncharacterized protein n=1 Tax=Aspergillus avenaceus TaxID=36643 RepID=A0A5N6TT15_ASPAV|nr:hypothetical protein BDV25DRAFT_140765 [Aspergillus avenaceus]